MTRLYIFAGISAAYTMEMLDCCRPVWGGVVVINNTDQIIPPGAYMVETPLVPLTFSQSQNAVQRLARRTGEEYFLTAHDDIRFEPSALVDFERDALIAMEADRNVGLIFAKYDALMIYRTAAVNDVGEWDTFLPQYGSDIDYFWRFEHSRWKMLNWSRPIEHISSNKIARDPLFRRKSAILDIFKDEYLTEKWGGIEPCQARPNF